MIPATPSRFGIRTVSAGSWASARPQDASAHSRDPRFRLSQITWRKSVAHQSTKETHTLPTPDKFLYVFKTGPPGPSAPPPQGGAPARPPLRCARARPLAWRARARVPVEDSRTRHQRSTPC